MKNITLQDLKVDLDFRQIKYFDHADRYEYTSEGKRTDNIVGSRVDCFGITADGERRVFVVSTDEVIPAGAFKLGDKISVVEPKVSAWFDRATNALRVSVKAKTIVSV